MEQGAKSQTTEGKVYFIIGLIFLVIGLVLTWTLLLPPIIAAQGGASTVTISGYADLGVVVPLVGIFLMIMGPLNPRMIDSYLKREKGARKPKDIIALVIMIAIIAASDFAMRAYIGSLGYKFH